MRSQLRAIAVYSRFDRFVIDQSELLEQYKKYGSNEGL